VTVMVINKSSDGPAPIDVVVSHFHKTGDVQAWQLTNANQISRPADLHLSGGSVATVVPAQSITLLVMPPAR
jgi:hypothetical protein